MTKKLISFDDEKSGLGLPEIVEDRLDLKYLHKSSSLGLETLATAIDFGLSEDFSIGVVADSTMNDGNESARIFYRMLGEYLPESTKRTYASWVNNEWNTKEDHPGTPTNAEGGLVFDDGFSRVGDVFGSSPDVVLSWEGSAGVWESDGNYTTTSSSSGFAYNDSGTSPNGTATLDLSMVTKRQPDVQNVRTYFFGARAAEGLWIHLGISNTGRPTFGFYYTSGPTTRTLQSATSLYGMGVELDSETPQNIQFSIHVDIQNITLTVATDQGSESWDYLISEDEYAKLGGRTSLMAMAESPGVRIDRIRVEEPMRGGEVSETVMWNGAIAGARVSTFDEIKIEEMFGEKNIDVLFVSLGHNNGTQDPTSFVNEITDWVSMWRRKHPETKGVVWVSQNPQFKPAINPVPHIKRQAAIRLSRDLIGLEYVPASEDFISRPDGGASLVNADGIHPTTPPVGSVDGDFGAVITAKAMMASIKGD